MYLGLSAKPSAVACNDRGCDSELVWDDGSAFDFQELSQNGYYLRSAELDPSSVTPDYMVLYLDRNPMHYDIYGVDENPPYHGLVCQKEC